MTIDFKPKTKNTSNLSLMQMATQPKSVTSSTKIDFKPKEIKEETIEEKKPFLETPAFDMEGAKPGLKTAGKIAINTGKSLISNVVGLVKGILFSPKTTFETAQKIGEEIAGAEQEGVKISDVLKELLPSAVKVLTPEAITKGIEAGKQDGIEEGVYQGVKSLSEDPFQLLPYGLFLKGISGKGKVTEPTKKIKESTEIISKDNEIVGKILQGKTSDIKAGTKALKIIDTKGIKTYSDLGERMKNKIENLAKTVDEKLDTDKTPQLLKELTVKANVGGKIVSTNYVDMALKSLKEAYETSKDTVNAERVNQIISKAEKQGLTAKEVNYIAREFGTEFKNKAFGKNGEPLTSINANAYENIRVGVKNTARQLMPDAGTRAVDAQITDLYKVEKLVNKMTEKVNALNQRIEKRNLVEKAFRNIGTGFNLITFGGPKELFTKIFFPSNVGLKTMNALDLEIKLAKNLRIIEQLETAKTDADFVNIITKYLKENKNSIIFGTGLGGLQEKE